MRLKRVTVTVGDLVAATGFYRDVLGLPVTGDDREATVTVGNSELTLTAGPAFAGAHHLACGIAPADFDKARGWLAERVTPLTVDGSEVVEGPPGWNSRSVYFLGPEGIVLEFIARDAHAHLPGSPDAAPRVRCLSEVGVAVADVATAVDALAGQLKQPRFPPLGLGDFAPIGDDDGLLIVVQQDRVWFPTEDSRAARGQLTVEVASHPGEVRVGNAVVRGA